MVAKMKSYERAKQRKPRFKIEKNRSQVTVTQKAPKNKVQNLPPLNPQRPRKDPQKKQGILKHAHM